MKSAKNQDCACFTQKTYVQKAKTPKLAALRLKQWVFLTLFSLVFWLTRRGLSAGYQSFSNNLGDSSFAYGDVGMTGMVEFHIHRRQSTMKSSIFYYGGVKHSTQNLRKYKK
jgi:hypothetical protein